MKTKVILISGKQGSGKTTLTNGLIVAMSKIFNNVTHIKFAKAIYEIHNAAMSIMNSYGISPKDKKDGNLMQLIGTEWGRNYLGHDIWVNITKNIIKEIDKNTTFYGDKSIVIIDDCRFENEVNIFPNESYTVRLKCPRDIRETRAEMWRSNDDHPSEIGLDIWEQENKFDIILDTHKHNTQECVSIIKHGFISQYDS